MSVFSEAAASMDATLLELFGDLATYRAGGIGAPVLVRVVVDRPTADAVAFGARLRAPTRLLQFRVAEVPSPAAGDTLTLEGGEVVTLAGAPERDELGTLWTVEG